jgi:choline kinase
MIKTYDPSGNIIVVLGFMQNKIREELADYNVRFIVNPFYNVTNSIASLWFAQEFLSEDVVLLDADIVMEDNLIQNVICVPTDKPYVLLDSSIKKSGDYNVQVIDDKVVVMSKNLDNYYGEYAGITKLDRKTSALLKKELNVLINEGAYDQWYEDALVQMIFNEDFELYYKDICNFSWTEVDCVSDMLLAKKINRASNHTF